MHYKLALLIFFIVIVMRKTNSEELEKAISFGGFAYYQIGQVVTSTDPDGATTGLPDKSWDQHVNIRFTMDALIQKRLRIIAGAELGMATFAKGSGGGTSLNTGFSAKEAQGIYTFGDDPLSKTPIFQVALGYFPFKYNPQATNMGEYLYNYRTGSYPAYIINDFDNCKSRLLGLRMSSVILGILRQDLLLTSEMVVGSNGNTPVGDYSLSYLVGYKILKIFDVGAGINLSRLIPLNPTLTTNSNNIVNDENGPVIENGDTLRLTLKSTKLMARFTFNPKRFFPELSIFGQEDGKIYSEVAVLGIKNYGTIFNDVIQRIPILVGINIPALKTLDVLSLELEYFGYPGNLTISQGSPVPISLGDEFSSQQMFRWSLFAQKTLVKGFCIKGLVGKDHFRTVDAGGSVTNEELLRGKGNWHYNLRFMYSF